MIFDELKKINSTTIEIRKFSRVVGLAFILLGILLLIFSGKIYTLLFATGIILLTTGLIVPIILLPFHKFWMGLSIILGFISTRVILTIIYYFILTPIAFFGRLTGKDFLDVKIDHSRKSYWIKKQEQGLSNENIKKQY